MNDGVPLLASDWPNSPVSQSLMSPDVIKALAVK